MLLYVILIYFLFHLHFLFYLIRYDLKFIARSSLRRQSWESSSAMGKVPEDVGFHSKWCFEFELVPLQYLAQKDLKQASQDFQTRVWQVRLTGQ